MLQRVSFTILFSALVIVATTGCGGDMRDLTYEEFSNLPAEEKQEFAKDISAEEMAAILRATMSNALEDTTALNSKTIGELIEEGRRINAEDDSESEE